MSWYLDRAKACFDSALVAQGDLREQYELSASRRDSGIIAGLHQQINYGLKAAEVAALIAQAEVQVMRG